ncbi:MAG: PAS domain S-box protein, partial [Bacteroidetes bacterium]|nr:PAS domain S-box protein [Bacteroidota bacterium]
AQAPDDHSPTTLRGLVQQAIDRREEVSAAGRLVPTPRPSTPTVTVSARPAAGSIVLTIQRIPDEPSSPAASVPADGKNWLRPDQHLHILESIAQGAPLSSIAADIVHFVERGPVPLTAVILQHDGDTGTLGHTASPSLDSATTRGLRDGLDVDGCALARLAIESRSRVHHDLRKDNKREAIDRVWDPCLDAVDAATGWTVPIMKSDTDVLGVLVLLTPECLRTLPLPGRRVDLATRLLHIALDRDRRREALQRSTEQFRQVTESMREVFWLRTADEVLYTSPSFEDVWGRPRDALYEDVDAYLDDVHPDDVNRVRAACDRLIRDDVPLDMHYRIIRRSDRRTRWVSASFRPVGNDRGDPRFAGIVRDVTEAYTSKRRLEQSEETYRNLIDHATDAIYVQNADGEFLDLSRGAVDMYGYSREEMIGKTPAFVSAGDRNDLEHVQTCFDRALDGEPQRFEFWGERADGSVFPKEVRLQRATYFGQHVVVAFALDITERKAAEEALRQSEKRYRLVVKNMKDVVMLHDATGATLWASPSVKEVLGRTPEEARAYTAFEIIHPNDRDEVIAHYDDLEGGTNRGPVTYRVRHADGHYIWLETLVQATYDEGGTLKRIQSSSRDVTERVQRQRELRRAKREAEDADRLKSAMLANMSHEIRTPLTSVIGFAEVLRDEVAPEHQRFASLIYDGSRRLMRTLDSVLQLSKLEAGLIDLNVEPVRIRQEIRDTISLLRPQADAHGIDLQVHISEDAPTAGTWDEGALHRILTNLVGNAIKFTHRGGRARVEVTGERGTVCIAVSDTGVGIDDAFLPHIFEPFKQETGGMRRSYEGSGLGLAIVHRLVEIMGGSIDVESAKGVGTTFTVVLPTAPGEPA